MKLKSFNYSICLLVTLFFSPILSEEKIDIWKNKKETPINSEKKKVNDEQKEFNLNFRLNSWFSYNLCTKLI